MKYSYEKYGKAGEQPENKTTIVCVTNQFSCERLIRAGRVIANISGTELLVVHVTHPTFAGTDGEAMQHLFDVSKENGADMSILYYDDPAKALIRFLKQNRAVNVVTGMPQARNSVLQALWNKFTHISFFTVDSEGGFSSLPTEDDIA